MRRASVVVLGVLLVAGGCATTPKEQLVTKSATVPDGVDLSGQWRLRRAEGESPRPGDGASVEAAEFEAISTVQRRRQGSRRKRSKDGALVRVFLENGNRLKVTQTDTGLFVSFDRSVVEEYRFGELRFASVGPIEAERVSGWEDGRYVIETLDEDGAMLTETYRLADGDRVLLRSILVEHKEETKLAVEQLFDRVDSP